MRINYVVDVMKSMFKIDDNKYTHCRRKVEFERCGFATFTLPWRNVVTTESETNKPCKARVKLPNKRVHILNVTP